LLNEPTSSSELKSVNLIDKRKKAGPAAQRHLLLFLFLITVFFLFGGLH
jgi:hypothetical protein